MIRWLYNKFFKGWVGEQKTTFNIFMSLNSKSYKRFHDIIIPSSNGTTQLDHLIVSEYGVFIVETKNKSGWIFGGEKQSEWTQVLYGKKYRFQNPLRQTYRQKKILAKFLNLDESNIESIVFFVGSSKFKTPMPYNVISSGLGRFIKKHKTKKITLSEVEILDEKINKHIAESNLTTRDHIRSIDRRHNSLDRCPTCGRKLVIRFARKGKRKGNRFLGCEGFPKCKFTRSI